MSSSARPPTPDAKRLAREFVFSVGTPDGARTVPWRVTTKPATRPDPLFPVEIYVDAHRPGRAFHASLHSSGKWHIGFDRPYVLGEGSILPPGEDRIRSRWEPKWRDDGWLRAFAIMVPSSEVQVPVYGGREERDDVYWAPRPGFGMVTHFNLIFTRPWVDFGGWPGSRAMKTRPVGALTMPGWGRLWLVVHEEPEVPDQREKWNAHKRAQGTSFGDVAEPRAILVGDFGDGTWSFTDLLMRPVDAGASVARPS